MSHLPGDGKSHYRGQFDGTISFRKLQVPHSPIPLMEGHLYGNKGGQKFPQLYRFPYIETPFIEAALH